MHNLVRNMRSGLLGHRLHSVPSLASSSGGAVSPSIPFALEHLSMALAPVLAASQAGSCVRTLFATAGGSAALGAVAFVQLSEEDDGNPEQTAETRMLEVSRTEMVKTVAPDDRGFSRLRHKAALFLDLYVWEPLCTGLRFLHLAIIFVPVVAAVPAIWLGRRQPERDNERTGTLWW